MSNFIIIDMRSNQPISHPDGTPRVFNDHIEAFESLGMSAIGFSYDPHNDTYYVYANTDEPPVFRIVRS